MKTDEGVPSRVLRGGLNVAEPKFARKAVWIFLRLVVYALSCSVFIFEYL